MIAPFRRNQLEPRRKLRLPRGPGDHDVARLHRLAQHIQHSARILGDLIEEQDPMMGQRDFPWPGRAAACKQDRFLRISLIRDVKLRFAWAPFP